MNSPQHEDLIREVNKSVDTIHTRLDRLEDKLDSYAAGTVKNTQDISWIKGSAKIIISAVISLGMTVLGLLFTHK